MNTKLYIITGLSGAGKSQALNIMEDLGFYCVDNLPVELVTKFVALQTSGDKKLSRPLSIGIDIRAGAPSLASLEKVLCAVKEKGITHKIIFFNASDDTLLKRYSETRRKHPLAARVIEGISKERKLLEKVQCIADKEIDTSFLTLGELKEIIAREMNIPSARKMSISIVSFGYKYGIPLDADMVMDVRFLPNPNYITSLRYKTGLEKEVRNFIVKQKAFKEFSKRYLSMLEFLIPHYIKEGKSHLTIGIGCTGGRHRSVMLTESTANFLKSKKLLVHVYHRDIEKLHGRS